MINKTFRVMTLISILLFAAVMYLIYGFEMKYLFISNAMFVVGVFYFFPGLIIRLGANEVFDGVSYAARRMFKKPKGEGNYFKTYTDYKEFKNSKNDNKKLRSAGLSMIIIGVFYIILSLVIGFM